MITPDTNMATIGVANIARVTVTNVGGRHHHWEAGRLARVFRHTPPAGGSGRLGVIQELGQGLGQRPTPSPPIGFWDWVDGFTL